MATKARSSLAVALLLTLGVLVSGCNDDETSDTAGTAAAAPAAFRGPGLAISGSPPTRVSAGETYSFSPLVRHMAGAKLSFTVNNRPVWAAFDAGTGTLSGTPTAASVGNYAQIQISVTDGATSRALAPFAISVVPASAVASLTISGSAATSAAVGSSYSFQPMASDVPGAHLTFSIANKPAWAAFNAGTGALSGTPSSSNVGTDSDIQISVSDGSHDAALAAFSISVTSTAQSVTLYWTPPSSNSNGSLLTDLAGYRIYYGTSAASMTTVVTVSNPNETSQAIGNLSPGKWYFAVTSFNTDKIESKFSAVVPFTITI